MGDSTKEEMCTVDSFIEGEKFTFSVPTKLIELDLKLGDRYQTWRTLRWDPWPTEPDVERRVGDYVLKYNPPRRGQHGVSRQELLEQKLIRPADGEPDTWYAFNWSWNKIEEEEDTLVEYPSFNGRHVMGVFKEDYPELQVSNRLNRDLKKSEGDRVMGRLRSPTPIPAKILKKVFGRTTPYIETFHTIYEHADRRNDFLMQVEWYRKNLIKLQRKLKLQKKKALAENRGITLEELREEKRQREKQKKRIERTQEWVKISKDVHNTIDWLQELVRRMGDNEEINREWYDNHRRTMRVLATKMKPLARHLKN